MPYHLAEMDAERRLYLPVNRNYVPLGLTTREWVSYEDYPDRFVRLTRPPHEIEGIVTNDGLYLYDDSAKSRVDYFERLERLMRYARLPK